MKTNQRQRRKKRQRETADIRAAAEPTSMEFTAAVDLDIEAAAADGEPRIPTFRMTAYTGGMMNLAGFYMPVVVDLAGLVAADDITILRDHDRGRVLGQSDNVELTTKTLKLSGTLCGSDVEVDDVVKTSKKGFKWKASIGASVGSMEYVREGTKVKVNGQNFVGPVNVARKTTLGEVSFVSIGADSKTKTSVAANATRTGETNMTFEQWLEANGFADADEGQKTILKANYDASQATPAGDVPPKEKTADPPKKIEATRDVDSIIAAAKAERERGRQISAIIEAAASVHGADLEALDELSAKAVAENMSVKDLELSVLRLTRPKAPAVHAREAVAAPEALEAAALMSVGFGGDDLAKSHGEQTVEAAERQFGRTIGLQEMILIAAQANGYTGRNRVTTGNWKNLIAWATGPVGIQAAGGFSTVDLTGILGSVANKALAKVAAEPQWVAPRIAGVASHANFHSHTVYSLAMSGELLPVGPTGELKHMQFGEESYTRQVGTRGAVLKLSRTDVINDDLGVFTKNASGLARKAYNTREKALMTVVCATAAGASHFTAARGNYLTGAGTAFGAAAMGTAIKAFRNVTGPDGDPIMVEPSIVLVPSTLEDEARRLLAAGGNVVMYGVGNAKSIGSSKNIYGGRFGGEPLVSPWLERSTLTGYSAAYWYLFADPTTYPCFEIAYLNGNQSPIVEYFGLEHDADTLGMTWRVYWDFGVGTAEWRAGVKSAGA